MPGVVHATDAGQLVAAVLAASTTAGDSLVALGGAAPTDAPFTTRRVYNPRYRPPTSGAPQILPGAQSRLRALDHFRAQVFHQAPSSPQALTQWEFEGGEQYRNDDVIELSTAGTYRMSEPEITGFRLSGRHRTIEASLMDAEAIVIGRQALLNRLRGGVVRYTDPRADRWIVLGGVPTPVPNTPTPDIALGGAAVENVRFEEAELSASAFGFWRGAREPSVGSFPDPDTLPGRGAMGNLAWRAPLAGGLLGGQLGAQVHNLEGHRALAAQHLLEWSYRGPTVTAWLSDEHGTRRARVLATDRIAPAPTREDRLNLQSRIGDGHAEAHVIGAAREGGDPALASRTLQIGLSGNVGRSAWYGGSDLVWDWRALTDRDERRFSLYGGSQMLRGHAVLGRIEHAVRGPDPDVTTAMVEASLALPRGARLGLEPRLGWEAGLFHSGDMAARFSWPMGWMSTRMTASLTAGGVRDEAFRGRLREAALSISLAPRLRDRSDLEVRRFDQNGRPLMEYSLSYDAEMERYETPGQGWFAGRDTGRVTVRVVRTGNGSGVADILISLDGKELRFTDADGMARFDQVQPGIHVVAVEERSLPANFEVAYASRVFVTVEPGRAPDLVKFGIARSERRTNF